MGQDENSLYKLKLTVRNRPGVLVRCAQILGRRNHNIEEMTVSRTNESNNISIMTIVASGKSEMINQVVRQLSKLIDVLDVVEQKEGNL